ncbi:uncharacterized protein V6R79_013978 [Siganus canaliculatus]
MVRALPPHRKQTESMMGKKRPLLLVALLVRLVLAATGTPAAGSGHRHGRLMPGSPRHISRNDPGLQKVVLAATCSYNNRSNDAFLFRSSSIHSATRQVVRGVRYVVDLDLSRTVCRKRDHVQNLLDCGFQPKGPLNQTLQCHVDVWTIPWMNRTDSVVLCGP